MSIKDNCSTLTEEQIVTFEEALSHTDETNEDTIIELSNGKGCEDNEQ